MFQVKVYLFKFVLKIFIINDIIYVVVSYKCIVLKEDKGKFYICYNVQNQRSL